MFNLKEYKAGEYVVASQKQFALDRDEEDVNGSGGCYFSLLYRSSHAELSPRFNFYSETKDTFDLEAFRKFFGNTYCQILRKRLIFNKTTIKQAALNKMGFTEQQKDFILKWADGLINLSRNGS